MFTSALVKCWRLTRPEQEATTMYPDNSTSIFIHINERLIDKYGDIVNKYNTDDWVFNTAGGAMVRKVFARSRIETAVKMTC